MCLILQLTAGEISKALMSNQCQILASSPLVSNWNCFALWNVFRYKRARVQLPMLGTFQMIQCGVTTIEIHPFEALNSDNFQRRKNAISLKKSLEGISSIKKGEQTLSHRVAHASKMLIAVIRAKYRLMPRRYSFVKEKRYTAGPWVSHFCAQGGGGVTIPEGVKEKVRCGTEGRSEWAWWGWFQVWTWRS